MWYIINKTGYLGNRLFSWAHIDAAALEINETVLGGELLDAKKFLPSLDVSKLKIYLLSSEGDHPTLPDIIL